ncbi:MAG: hypothetical protein IH899_18570, partial [Planctomycetes bacterium]|nr:hypothetical protein [Planctomycetota bacterium]
MIRFRSRGLHPAAVCGEHREAGDLKRIGQFLFHPQTKFTHDTHQQLLIPVTQHLEESLAGFAGSRLPVKNLSDNLARVLEPLSQGRAIGGGPKQSRGRQHSRFPFAPLTNMHADKQR